MPRLRCFTWISRTRPSSVADHRVEQFRPVDREGQEGEPVVGQPRQRVFRKPDRVGQADQHGFVGMDQRQGAEDRVAQTGRLGLHDISDGGRADRAAVILQDVGFPGRDDKADLVGAGAAACARSSTR